MLRNAAKSDGPSPNCIGDAKHAHQEDQRHGVAAEIRPGEHGGPHAHELSRRLPQDSRATLKLLGRAVLTVLRGMASSFKASPAITCTLILPERLSSSWTTEPCQRSNHQGARRLADHDLGDVVRAGENENVVGDAAALARQGHGARRRGVSARRRVSAIRSRAATERSWLRSVSI